MSEVVGFASSHGPMLSTTPQQWAARAAFDRKNRQLIFRGEVYDFDTLLSLRASPELAELATPEKMRQQHERSQNAIETLAERFSSAGVTRAVIVGNDHKEAFSDECFGAITVYAGGSIMHVPFTQEDFVLMAPGVAEACDGHTPRQPVSYEGVPVLADAIISHLTDAGFDVARSTVLPLGKYSNRSIPHAFGYVYRRVMNDRVVPNVPIFINTFYPPNRPSPARCVRLGQKLAQTLGDDSSSGTTAVIASGGLSHFVIEDDLDQELLEALSSNDLTALSNIDPRRLESGSSEILNWIVLGATMATLGKKMELIDYVPCHRTDAGTGNAMAFASWS